MRFSPSSARGGGGEVRREERTPEIHGENGSRRADSPRSNASLDSFSQPVRAATSSSLPPIGPPSDPARPRARARAPSLSPARSPLCRRASRSSPHHSRLSFVRSHPRARAPRTARHIHCVDTWAPEWKCFSPTRQILLFTFPREIFAPLTLRVAELAFSSIIFFFFSYSS